ncbi:MAG: Ig-like domain-containing protein [Clostridia bacterium]|nr:Ig-like domain-containing protein [Clostridia bacterium]
MSENKKTDAALDPAAREVTLFKNATEEQKDKRGKALYAGVIALLVLIFVVGFIYGLNQVLSMEGSYPPAELTEGKSPIPSSAEEAVAYAKKVTDEAVAGKPKFHVGYDYSIDNDSIEAGDEARLKTTLLYIADGVEEFLDKTVESADADYGAGFADVLCTPENLNAADVVEFTNDYIYYKCISCGEESKDPLEACEACGSDYPYQMRYRDDNVLTITLKDNGQVLKDNFSVWEEKDILDAFKDASPEIMTLDKVDVKYDALQVILKVNRATDELKSLEYRKVMTVTATLGFPNDAAKMDGATVTAGITQTEKNEFMWPSLELSDDKMEIEPKKKDNLLATLNCDKPTDYEATWTSSDENIVKVDDEGYLTAGKEPGTATITASFEFNGKTYSDTCLVEVKVPVESMKLNKRKASVSAGDTLQLKGTVSPSKATHHEILWETSDETVATVDDNGLVTAVAPGTVKIIGYSKDGYFRSTCEVTVK